MVDVAVCGECGSHRILVSGEAGPSSRISRAVSPRLSLRDRPTSKLNQPLVCLPLVCLPRVVFCCLGVWLASPRSRHRGGAVAKDYRLDNRANIKEIQAQNRMVRQRTPAVGRSCLTSRVALHRTRVLSRCKDVAVHGTEALFWPPGHTDGTLFRSALKRRRLRGVLAFSPVLFCARDEAVL